MTSTPPGQPWNYQQPSQPNPWPQTYQYPPAPTQKSRFGIGMLVGFILGVAAALAGIFVVAVVMNLSMPADLGDDGYTDALYASCAQGDMAACDSLYWETAFGSDLEEFGATCGGRTVTPKNGECVSAGVEATDRHRA